MSSLSTQVLVIGGGVTGLGIAWDASLRGLKTVLVEKGDLGQGTSGRYHGLLHSGGRYVLSDPVSAADCANENAILRQIASPAIESTGGYFVSTPTDPLDYPDRWVQACQDTGVSCEEIPSSSLLSKEPVLNPRISRAFYVADASMDSFDLTHMLYQGIRQAGGMILLHHEVTGFTIVHEQLQSTTIFDLLRNRELTIDAEFVINAAGPWAGKIAALANINLPLALGKGTMLAMSQRFTSAVINRCKPPSDGDIIVPVGTVSVLGTTDIRVETPDDLRIEPWELDLLLTEAEVLIPGISSKRALRAWAGIRPLVQDSREDPMDDRLLTRAHTIVDHRDQDDLQNIISVFGGKLTTYRLMAEEVVDLVANRLKILTPSSTRSTQLPSKDERTAYHLPDRLDKLSRNKLSGLDLILCECELVSSSDFLQALQSDEVHSIDDIRRDLRLGMGTCQAAFCGYRATGLLEANDRDSQDMLAEFTEERWKGIQPLSWGTSLRQIEMLRRFNLEFLHVPKAEQ